MIIDNFTQYASCYDLFIFDINGVLDNNHEAKVRTLSEAFPALSDLQISKINIGMERAYEKSKDSPTTSHIVAAFEDNGIVIDSNKAKELANRYYDLNRIKPEIINFLNQLSETKKVCLYTSLSKAKVDYITSRRPLSSNILVFAREEQVESKPSISNLEAILHINKFGSGHTDSILTEDKNNAEKFMNYVDSAGVYHNTSTRFSDGFRYGFGAEVGISTNKTHARGPVGLDGLTIYKYKLFGQYQTVAPYANGEKTFKHKFV